LGAANDGFLYIWHINARTGAATLHASNKCVSHINRMAWMGNKLVTVGVRHVKVWKVDDLNATMRISKARQSDMSFLSSSTHKTLPGRNCILESLKEATFTSVVAIAHNKAIVASDRGDICLIDDSESEHRFIKLTDAGFGVSSLAVDVKGRLHITGSQGGLKTLNIMEITGRLTPPPSPPPRVESPTISVTGCNQIGVIACLKDYIITVDSQRAIRLSALCPSDDDAVVGDVVQTLPAHGDAVLGVNAGLVQPNVFDASYYTWAADGTIIFWRQGSFRGSLRVPLEQLDDPDAVTNELRTVRVSSDGSFLVAGDKFGVLRFIDCASATCLYEFKAHTSEITSIAIHEEAHLTFVACASRDRTVQVFTRMGHDWELFQTLDEHVGAVNGVSFSGNGIYLISTSSDRNLVVRELKSLEEDGIMIRAFVMLRTIVLKATPVSSAWDVDLEDALLISTMDRQVHKFDVRTGQCLSNFRACDTDGGDAVVLSSLVHISRGWGAPLIAGVSSTDKSIRVYDESGSLVARDWGHTEGISDIALVQAFGATGVESSEKSLITVAVDGTIFVWGLALQAHHRHDISKSMDLLAPATPTNQDLLSNKPPLRRVFSQSELARFQRSPEETNAIPTGNKSPKLRKKVSKFSLASTPKLEPSPMSTTGRENRAGGWQGQGTLRRNKNRSPSPPSPRNPQLGKRRASMDVKTRTKVPANEFGSIGASTESLCRTLRAYRKRLANTTETMSSELAKEVERELASTARAIGDKTKEFDETVMVKLLDQYSERLVSMLDEKIAASVAQRVRESSVGYSDGADTPILAQPPSRSRAGSEGKQSADDSGTETLVLETTEKLTIE
jgi:WD40 repeat protein